jgi:hypothetical protein
MNKLEQAKDPSTPTILELLATDEKYCVRWR